MIATHQVREVEALIDRLLVLHDARVLFQGSVSGLSRSIRISFGPRRPDDQAARSMLVAENQSARTDSYSTVPVVAHRLAAVLIKEEQRRKAIIQMDQHMSVFSLPANYSEKNSTFSKKAFAPPDVPLVFI